MIKFLLGFDLEYEDFLIIKIFILRNENFEIDIDMLYDIFSMISAPQHSLIFR